MRRERGTQIVELALVLPLLVFLTLLISEAVGIVRAHQVLTNAARETARMAALNENQPLLPPKTALQDKATCYLARNNVFPPAIPSLCSDVGKPRATCVSSNYSVSITQVLIGSAPTMKATRVAINCGYRLHYFRLSPFNISPTIPLGSTVTFRNFW